MPTPSIQILRTDAQQVLNLDSISAVRSVVAASLANANAGTPLNPNLTTQQLWNEFYQIVTQPKSDIESIIANQLMKFLYAPPAPGGAGADKQVIFNDGGVLAGDPGLTFDKVTNALTITGDLTVRTNKLVVNATGVGAGKTPSYPLDVAGNVSMTGAGIGTRYLALMDETNTYAGSLTIQAGGGSAGFGGGIVLYGHSHATYPGAVWIGRSSTSSGPIMFGDYGTGPGNKFLQLDTGGVCTWYDGAGGTRMTLNANGLGIGVTPSAWNTLTPVQVKNAAFSGYLNNAYVTSNSYYNANHKYIASDFAAMYVQTSGQHQWYNAPSGTANNAITFTQAMTLDASGNLLVGTTSATAGAVFKVTGTVANGKSFEVFNTASSTNSAFYCLGSGVVNGVATGAGAGGLITVNKDSGNSRSISAAGTINASGADYAEYMTKAIDFVLSKGDVAGIDANGKLTNVFADAVSFVVKSTDPSYVGNDKWSVDLEGDVLEAARQLVDRIAFAGQVPVNVTGAKAGDYIVPVVDGTGIKGIAVSKPTFEQYQIAVGKVIAIDTDGRARIIVKVA